jgi:hypothetical protein
MRTNVERFGKGALDLIGMDGGAVEMVSRILGQVDLEMTFMALINVAGAYRYQSAAGIDQLSYSNDTISYFGTKYAPNFK